MSDDVTPHDQFTPDDAGPPVGSLASEAAKLLGAFTTWASQPVADGDRAEEETTDREHAQPIDGVSASHEPPAAEDAEHAPHAECTSCPVCRAVAAVREASPEVKDHLATAATSLVAAASTLFSAIMDSSRPQARSAHTGSANTDSEDKGSEDEGSGAA